MSERDDSESPGAVARAYFDAMDAREFEAAVRYMDPAKVVDFHQNMSMTLRVITKGFTREELKLGDLDLTTCLGDELVEHLTNPPPQGIVPFPMAREFAGIESVQQLDDIGPPELLERHLRAQTPEHQEKETIREGHHPFPDGIVASDRRQVIGAVREGEDLAHVVWRSTATYRSGRIEEDVFAMTLRRTEAGWRVTFEFFPPGTERITCGYDPAPRDDLDPEPL
jgi:hypothetical protein